MIPLYKLNRFVVQVLRKIVHLAGVLIGTTLLIFILMKSAPGDPYSGYSDVEKKQRGLIPENVSQPRQYMNQYLNWLGNLVRLDLGYPIKITADGPVFKQVASAYGKTLVIVAGALLISLLISLPLGFLSALKQQSKFLQFIVKMIELISSVPVFITGFFILLVCMHPPKCIANFKINLSSRDNFGIIEESFFFFFLFVILGLGNGSVIEFIKHIHNEISMINSKMYMKAVKARSADYFKHLGRNALIPVLAIISNRFIFLLSGAVVIEKIFTIQGVGLKSIDAAEVRDYPLIMGIVVFTVVIVVLLRTILDIISQQINPRVKSYE